MKLAQALSLISTEIDAFKQADTHKNINIIIFYFIIIFISFFMGGNFGESIILGMLFAIELIAIYF